MAEQITPFDPKIPKGEVDRLFRKLADSRLPEIPIVPDAGEDYGAFFSSFPLHLHVDKIQVPPWTGSRSCIITGYMSLNGRKRKSR
jgi:hypothetical protein